jgi:hypothetical protein
MVVIAGINPSVIFHFVPNDYEIRRDGIAAHPVFTYFSLQFFQGRNAEVLVQEINYRTIADRTIENRTIHARTKAIVEHSYAPR